jgi:hypothetical protein
MMLKKTLLLAAFLSSWAAIASAQTISAPPIGAVVVPTCGTQAFSDGSTPAITQDRTGKVCDAGGGGGGGGAVTIAGGADVTEGTIGDTHTTGTVVGFLNDIYTALIGPATAANQTSVQANAGSDASKALAVQGVTGGKALSSAGATASGASLTENPLANGCRAATAAPTAVTDGQKVNAMCGAEGKAVTLPYSIKELDVRGTASGTDNAAHSIIASAGGSLKNYITDVQCGNSSSTSTFVTFSDAASSQMYVPGQGGNNFHLNVPLATAAATAFSFTASTGVTTMVCNAQGYTGL